MGNTISEVQTDIKHRHNVHESLVWRVYAILWHILHIHNLQQFNSHLSIATPTSAHILLQYWSHVLFLSHNLTVAFEGILSKEIRKGSSAEPIDVNRSRLRLGDCTFSALKSWGDSDGRFWYRSQQAVRIWAKNLASNAAKLKPKMLYCKQSSLISLQWKCSELSFSVSVGQTHSMHCRTIRKIKTLWITGVLLSPRMSGCSLRCTSLTHTKSLKACNLIVLFFSLSLFFSLTLSGGNPLATTAVQMLH